MSRFKTALDAVAGLLVLAGGIAVMVYALILVEKAPEFFAINIAAGVVAAAIYFKAPSNHYNITMGHPDSVEIITKLNKLLDKRGGDA